MKIATNPAQPPQRLQDPSPRQAEEAVSSGARNDSAMAAPRVDRRATPPGTQARIYMPDSAAEPAAIARADSFFNPPQRVNGRSGYPLGPTSPPRLGRQGTAQPASQGARLSVHPQSGSAHYSTPAEHGPRASTSTAAQPQADLDDEEPVATTSRQAGASRSAPVPTRGGSEHAGNDSDAPVRPPRRKEQPLPPPPTDRELLFYSKFNSIDEANRQLGHLKMDRNPAWLNMGTKEPYFGENHHSTIGPLSNERNSPFMKRWQEVWGTEETRGKNLSSIWQTLIKNQQTNLKNYIDDQTMDLVLFNSKFHETLSDPTKPVPLITPNTYRNELTTRQDFKRDVYILQREALNDDSPIFKLDDRALKSLNKKSFKWPFAGEGNAVSKLMPYKNDDATIQYIRTRKTYYEDALYRFGNGDNSMQGVIKERSRLQGEFDNDVAGYFRDRQLKAQLEFWNWSKVNVAGGIMGFHLIDYLRKTYGT